MVSGPCTHTAVGWPGAGGKGVPTAHLGSKLSPSLVMAQVCSRETGPANIHFYFIANSAICFFVKIFLTQSSVEGITYIRLRIPPLGANVDISWGV